ncbi:MAG: aminotransferase class I/II-fold pyridoxal phosphate-dependent enzyme [Alphaproteobacteria bacterium]|nr:aminotransferase class I/II-fold pyridoxal phosphate-dependent enzyme [Alphaproteobacteria bacterium]
MNTIAFIDLAAQQARIRDRIDRAVAGVLAHGNYILGPEVEELETRLADFCGAKHCITCANGTDALQLVLMAEGVGPGDAVFVPAFTFVATAEIVPLAGATPFFVDVRERDFNMDPASLEAGIAEAERLGLRPRVVVPVDLFGHPADYDGINAIAARYGMTVVADAAQGFGARYKHRRVGALASYTTTSFFPAKPLGCYGDGGAIFTDDPEQAALLRSLRFHGKGSDKYDNIRVGLNSRLDTIQAAILIEKLAIFEDELAARQQVANRYAAALDNIFTVPRVAKDCTSAWAQYTIVAQNREALAAACKAQGVPTAIYYPIPLNRQTGYKKYPAAPGGTPNSEHLAAHVLSLPMHPYLDADTQGRVIEALRNGIGQTTAGVAGA